MRVLAIDTATEFGSIALLEDAGFVLQKSIVVRDGFSGILFGEIRSVLLEVDWQIGQIDVFAAASGPGSFTGVRIGLSAVKGLADACGKRAVGVSNLKALAACGSAPRRGVVMDARRGEIFAAVYDAELNLVSPEWVGSAAEWLSNLRELPDEFLSPLGEGVLGKFPGPWRQERAVAGAVAAVAYRELVDGGRVVENDELDANYVRRSDAELKWRDPTG